MWTHCIHNSLPKFNWFWKKKSPCLGHSSPLRLPSSWNLRHPIPHLALQRIFKLKIFLFDSLFSKKRSIKWPSRMDNYGSLRAWDKKKRLLLCQNRTDEIEFKRYLTPHSMGCGSVNTPRLLRHGGQISATAWWDTAALQRWWRGWEPW